MKQMPFCKICRIELRDYRSIHCRSCSQKIREHKPASEETKKKMSLSRMNHFVSLETRKKLSIANIGKYPTKETRQKMAEASKKTLNGFKIGHKIWLGKKHKEEAKLKLRINHNPSSNKSGEDHWNWQGGITQLNLSIRAQSAYDEWRNSVFEENNFTCKQCGVRGGKLHAHHKKAFSVILMENNINSLEKAMCCAELWDIGNGETLCVDCHKETDNYGFNVTKQKVVLQNVVS